MRDIVYKKVPSEESPVDQKTPASTPLSSLPPLHEPPWYENFLSKLNQFAGTVEQKLSDEIDPKQAVIAPPVPVQKNLPAQHKVHTKKKTGEKISEKASQLKKGLKTTHGKLLVAHTVALAALTVFSTHQYLHYITAQATNVSAADSTTTTRQYLPVGSNGTTSQAFQDATAALPRKNLQLYSWVTPWNQSAIAQNRAAYSGLSAFWLTVGADGTSLTPKSDWQTWDTFATAQKRDSQPLYLSVTGDPTVIVGVLSNVTLEQQQIKNLLDTVVAHHFDGIDIDYEGLGSENKDLFNSFIRTLTAAFHQSNKTVAVTLEARIANQVPMDWHTIGQMADEVRIMAYDYHAINTSNPGPIAPLAWIKEVTGYAVSEINPSKLIIGLGNYGYDWQEPDLAGENWTGLGISQEKAVAQAKDNNAIITRMTGIDTQGYDIGNIPSYNYTDAEGKSHTVWFEDAQSLQDKLSVVSQYPVKGVIFWSVGLGDPNFWSSQVTK